MATLLQTQDVRPTLLFIPDISGFTQFVNSTEINHSRHIIEELLEIIIDSDTLGLEVSEIEGDAVLFYRDGEAPSSEELLVLVRSMYTAFHTHLKKYENRRICQCGACSTTNNLTLKFVAHFGETAKNQVKQFTKLFGADVIIAHRLLKNDVQEDEYLLVTDSLHVDNEKAQEVAEDTFRTAESSYDLGAVTYAYLDLQHIRRGMPEPQVEDFGLPGVTVNVMTQEAIINAPINLVFDVVSDLSFRHHWQDGLSGSDDLNHKIAQSGSTHRCVIKGDASDPFFVSHGFEKKGDTITFSDTNHKSGVGSVFSLQKLENDQTKVQVHTFMKRNPLKQLMFNLLLKKKFLRIGQASWQNLDAYCSGLVARGEDHSSQIVLQDVTTMEKKDVQSENKGQDSFCFCPVLPVLRKAF
ncbi:MAG: DUF2652 domain-containing protein [Rhodothermales bacterium]